MRTASLLAAALTLLLATELHAQSGQATRSSQRAQSSQPSRARLAEMGLADLQIVSHHEASTIRVYGHAPTRWGNLYPYVQGVSRLRDDGPITRSLILR